jgi:phosphatidate cytidylyltransferase
MRLIGKRDPASSLNDISPVLLAVLYIPCLLGFQIFLRNDGPEWIPFLYGCVWASDSLAYYVGKAIGKRRLYVEVSPNKTVAGALGSLIGGALAGVLLNLGLIHSMSTQKSLMVGMVIGITTIIGDLVESMFKRDAGVKNSGTLIPGHGGILDKVDGVLFAGPVFYWITRHVV